MKSYLFVAAVAASSAVFSGAASARPIERACMASDRGGNRSLCGCIQQAADMPRGGGDRRGPGKFSKTPVPAQKPWMSQSKPAVAFGGR